MEASHVPERRHILKDGGELHSHHRDNPKPRAKKEINKRYITYALKKKRKKTRRFFPVKTITGD
jgi:hypothetical protein